MNNVAQSSLDAAAESQMDFVRSAVVPRQRAAELIAITKPCC